jgi:hypothetical protein
MDDSIPAHTTGKSGKSENSHQVIVFGPHDTEVFDEDHKPTALLPTNTVVLRDRK